jgi:hypothetical protein|tara:strand:+ start:5417 stop:6433 length:1017 start_codon:yes stop_codon:yes gene_type:complete
MTLNEIAYNIADASGRGTNAAYIERLKFQIKYYRALLIRRDQERNTYLPDAFIQTIEVPISPVTLTSANATVLTGGDIDPTTTINDQALHKSDFQLPEPVRLKRGVPFFEVAYFQNNYTGALSTTEDELLGSITTNTTDGTDGIYVASSITTSGSGTGAVISVTVSGNTVSAITVTTAGSGYAALDTLTIPKATIGGTVDVIITLRPTGDIDPSQKTVSKIPLIPITPGNQNYSSFTKYTSKVPKYFHQNNRIYTLNIPTSDSILGSNYVLPKLFVRAIFEDVDSLRGFTYLGEPCYNDDMEFPCTMDMVQQITQSILSGEYRVENPVNDNEEVQPDE